MPPIVYDIFELLGVLIRLVGMLLLGLGVGWFTLEAFRKEAWQLQIAVFLGFVGLAIAMTRFATAGALGMFGIGAGAALLLWGKSKKEEKKEEDD